jgi:hypothetical protein
MGITVAIAGGLFLVYSLKSPGFTPKNRQRVFITSCVVLAIGLILTLI